MTDNKVFVDPRNNYNRDLAKAHIHNLTMAQWLISILLVLASATALLVAGILSVWSNVWWLSVVAAEFSAMLIISLIGGPLTKADIMIHALGEELCQTKDWHENLRSLYRKKWLNVVPDIIALLPGLILFISANFLIADEWKHSLPVAAVIVGNCLLLLYVIVMMPVMCGEAHKEVKKQVEINEGLRPQKQASSLS